jgi:inactivated superfamily I helicase
VVRAVPANATNLTADGTGPENAALVWVGAHVPRSAVVVADNYAWLEMRAAGGLAASYGVPFSKVEMYWEVATDPAVQETLLHNDWNSIDYVLYDPDMRVDAHTFDMRLILQALQHGVLIKRFANTQFWIDVYQVQHRQAVSQTADPQLLQQLTAPIGGR